MIDTKTNTKIVYLYVNQFKWAFSTDHEAALGHPKEKTLYRGVYNTDTKTWRGIYELEGKMKGFFLKTLNSKESVSEEEVIGYTSHITEISPSTILNCDLQESDLDQLLKWLENNNKDLINTLWPKNEIKGFRMEEAIGEKEFVPLLTTILYGKDSEFADLLGILHSLRTNDPLIFEALTHLIDFLEQGEPTDDSVIDPTWIRMDKLHGTGANMAAALEKISRYSGGNRRTNLREEDLMGTIRDLLNEQIRRNINGE